MRVAVVAEARGRGRRRLIRRGRRGRRAPGRTGRARRGRRRRRSGSPMAGSARAIERAGGVSSRRREALPRRWWSARRASSSPRTRAAASISSVSKVSWSTRRSRSRASVWRATRCAGGCRGGRGRGRRIRGAVVEAGELVEGAELDRPGGGWRAVRTGRGCR